MRALHWVTIVLVAGVLVAACRQDSGFLPPTVRWSAIPDRELDNVRAQHTPLMEAVCQAASIPCRWVDANTYEAAVDGLRDGSIDVVFLGGVGFSRAHARHGAIPLVMRDIDTRFTSVVVVRSGDPARSLRDLRGRSFTFGNRDSTSGHFMARYFLGIEGVEPERFFSRIEYSASHDSTLNAVADGKIDAGAMSGIFAYAAVGPGGARAKDLRMLWETSPYPDYVWAARRELPAGLRQRLMDAFLDLDFSTPASKLALEREMADGFLPAEPEDFRLVAEVLRRADRL